MTGRNFCVQKNLANGLIAWFPPPEETAVFDSFYLPAPARIRRATSFVRAPACTRPIPPNFLIQRPYYDVWRTTGIAFQAATQRSLPASCPRAVRHDTACVSRDVAASSLTRMWQRRGNVASRLALSRIANGFSSALQRKTVRESRERSWKIWIDLILISIRAWLRRISKSGKRYKNPIERK